MKKFRFISIILLVCIFFTFGAPSAFAVEDPYLKSTDECLLIDIATGKPLYSITPEQNHSIASLTKIMTVLLAVEAVERGDVSLSEEVTASENVRYGLDVSSSNADIQAGEIMSFENLMYCALVHSANDACNVIAERVGGSILQFVTLMNNRAKELGCVNTQFNDTCGMLNRSDGHYSCANDLYLITMEALSHPLFYTICNTVDYTVPATNVHAERELHNSNALISNNGLYGSGYIYDGTVGVKTGFTKPAGYCLVSTCEKNGLHLMCIVLGCNGPLTYTSVPGEYQNFIDSATLYDWGFNNFAYKTIFLAGERLKRFSVENAKDDETVAVAPDQNLELLLAKDISDNQIHVDVSVDDSKLVAPIAEGDILGSINVYVSDELYATCNAVAATSVDLERRAAFNQSVGNFFSSKGFKIFVGVAIGLIVIFVVAYFYLKFRRRQQLLAKMRRQQQKKAYRQSQEIYQRRASENAYRQQYYEEDDDEQSSYADYDDEDEDYYPDTNDNSQYFESYDDSYRYAGREENYNTSNSYPDDRYSKNLQSEHNNNASQSFGNYYKESFPEENSPRSDSSSKDRWEEANLDDVLRSLGINPEDYK